MLNIYLFSGKGDVTITIADEDLLKLFQGKLNPQQVNITNDFAYLTLSYCLMEVLIHRRAFIDLFK